MISTFSNVWERQFLPNILGCALGAVCLIFGGSRPPKDVAVRRFLLFTRAPKSDVLVQTVIVRQLVVTDSTPLGVLLLKVTTVQQFEATPEACLNASVPVRKGG
ncbi:hypothetical protein VaNZ11_006978 [Volvox africanus]|uniref:Uncharacterized protein n=1 Tax=Volvox africanus TaxID=51714 RepID=A0ABQ5S317_9CHLO|nr:hypothetical protein VaNZ11_006978 [Volvox africanus]